MIVARPALDCQRWGGRCAAGGVGGGLEPFPGRMTQAPGELAVFDAADEQRVDPAHTGIGVCRGDVGERRVSATDVGEQLVEGARVRSLKPDVMCPQQRSAQLCWSWPPTSSDPIASGRAPAGIQPPTTRRAVLRIGVLSQNRLRRPG